MFAEFSGFPAGSGSIEAIATISILHYGIMCHAYVCVCLCDGKIAIEFFGQPPLRTMYGANMSKIE